MFVTRVQGTWHSFQEHLKRNALLFVLAVIIGGLLTDRIEGWANHEIDRLGLDVLKEVLVSPLLLPMLVICLLLVRAFIESDPTRHITEPETIERIVEKLVPVEPPDYERLKRIDSFNRERLSSLILQLEGRSATFRDLNKEIEPYFTLTLRYVNMSIHTLVFSQEIKGRLGWGDNWLDASLTLGGYTPEAFAAGFGQGQYFNFSVRVVPRSERTRTALLDAAAKAPYLTFNLIELKFPLYLRDDTSWQHDFQVFPGALDFKSDLYVSKPAPSHE